MGGLAGITWPYAVTFLRYFSPSPLLWQLGLLPIDRPFALIVSQWSEPGAYVGTALTLAVGIFGGWIFWRIGVRPAALPLDTLTQN